MAYQRNKKPEFGIITKAKTLTETTVRITTSSKFPKKFRFVFGNRIMDRVIDILDNVVEANELSLTDQREWEERQYHQKKVLTCCKTALNLIETMFISGAISMEQCELWSRQVLDVKNMTIAWRNKDRERSTPQ